MTLRPEVVAERLRKLREVVRNLSEIRAASLEDFRSDFRSPWLAERGLQLAAEIVFDIGNHLLASQLNTSPGTYEDVTRRLFEHAVISRSLRDRLTGLGGFRNILVHAYLEIDSERVYRFLIEELDCFIDFATEIEAFLKQR